MLASAGHQSKPSIATLSSKVAFLITVIRLAARQPSTGGQLIMSIVSSYSNLATAPAAPSFSEVFAIPFRNVTTKCGLSRVPPSFSREGVSALDTCCCSGRLCNCRSALSASKWHRSTFGVEHRPVISELGFLTWRAVGPSFEASWVCQISRLSSLPRRGIQGVETRDGFGSRSKFHTASHQEGRYICAQEEFRLESLEEDGVGIEDEDWAGRGIEAVGTDAGEVEKKTGAPEIWVVNFYYFVSIEDPHDEVARHASFLEGKDVRGRIYISHQGINAQLSGPEEEAIEYAEWVKKDSRFADVLVQISPSPAGHAFPRLRLRYKPSLVQVEGGTLHLPVTNPSARAVHLSPREWSERLNAATVLSYKIAAVSHDDGNSQDEQHNKTSKARKPVVLLDVRNGYEWDVGHFKGAQRPNVDCFKSTEFGLNENETGSDPLANVDKEAVDVMMYCTGGIRCDVYSTILSYAELRIGSSAMARSYPRLVGTGIHFSQEICRKTTSATLIVDESGLLVNRSNPLYGLSMLTPSGMQDTFAKQKGFKNLYTLKGGVSNYLKEEGARRWAGNLFVFDSRLAVPPKDYDVKDSLEEEALLESDTTEEKDCANPSATQVFARCRLCGDPISEPRHRNCANVDCSLLYLSCEDCRSQHNGCCSTRCSAAPRLRPLLSSHQYDRWYKYRPQELKPPKPADYVSRRALKRRRRKERRKLLASEQSSLQILDSHLSLTEIHEEQNFATISEGQQ